MSFLSDEILAELSQLLSVTKFEILTRFESPESLNSFTVPQLKDFIKWSPVMYAMKGGPSYLKTGGRKKELIAIVWRVLCELNHHANESLKLQNANQIANNYLSYQHIYPQYNRGICQQYNITTEHFSRLVKHPNFIERRSPFFHALKRCCVMPVFSKKRIQFRISLSQTDINQILQSLNSKEKQLRALHLRLFNSVTHQHQHWNASQCDVRINNRSVMIDTRNHKTGNKQKGYFIVSPLVITSYAHTNMDFEITSNGDFSGVAVIEIVLVFNVQSIAQQVIARCTPVDPSQKKRCSVCKKDNDLLRCSRCKSVWYCGIEHQGEDWRYHQTVCIPAETRPKLKTIEFKTEDNDVICGETKVSLRCPLSICRISTAVRGTECTHPQCMDLMTFLSFSHWTGCWQCPTCTKPLKFNELVVDMEMMRILKETDEDIDVVRLHPNGTFKPITLQEQREEDKKSQMDKKRKNRKKNNEIAKECSNASSTSLPNQRSVSNESSNSAPEDDHGQTVDNPILLE